MEEEVVFGGAGPGSLRLVSLVRSLMLPSFRPFPLQPMHVLLVHDLHAWTIYHESVAY